ncbi:hypothetical protein [Burkholderia vietnamiensis]|uniref:hypothetical protein n=1 Tax=Burkholderia vietnamiensis TaxID=60552 RepID=UPI000A9AD6E6|nr:hypothetical protein [Burkholderia vietnamiensis]HDR9028615.1 hypothetical protein [Burkholderia vietnamiensis]
MFGFFKKKPPAPAPVPASPAGSIIRGAANLLELALMVSRSVDDYQVKLHSAFVRGYFVGFFDAALQHAGVPIESDEQFIALMIIGHLQLLAKDVPSPAAYTAESMRLQGGPVFDTAQMAGGQEYVEFYTGKVRTPIRLSGYFHDTPGPA